MPDIRESLKDRIQQYETNSASLGRELYLMKESREYKNWGFRTFDDYIRSELGMDARRAYYHIAIWSVFGVELGLTEAQISDLGWTKAGHLTSLVRCGTINRGNIHEWIHTAKSMTGKALSVKVKQLKEEAKTAGYKPSDVPVTTWLDIEPTFDGTMHRVMITLFPEQHETFMRALSVASKMSGSNKQSHLIDMICLSFLAGNPKEAVDDRHQLNWFVRQLEATFNVKLMAFRNTKDLKVTLQTAIQELK